MVVAKPNHIRRSEKRVQPRLGGRLPGWPSRRAGRRAGRLAGGRAGRRSGVRCLRAGVAFLLGGVVVRLYFLQKRGLSFAEIETKVILNQGIHRSAWSALAVGLSFGLPFGLLFGLPSLVGEPGGRAALRAVLGCPWGCSAGCTLEAKRASRTSPCVSCSSEAAQFLGITSSF